MEILEIVNQNINYIILVLLIIIIILIIVLILQNKSSEGFDISNIINMYNVEFRSALDPKICVHKIGSDTNYSNELSLHWWNVFNHPNSKYNIIYYANDNLYTIYRRQKFNKYYWNASNSTIKLNRHTNANDYESFIFEWLDNNMFRIKAKNGRYIGGITAHNKDLKLVSSNLSAKFELYSYNLNRYLVKSDFVKTSGISKIINAAKSSIKNGTNTMFNIDNIGSFNLKYNNKYLIPVKDEKAKEGIHLKFDDKPDIAPYVIDSTKTKILAHYIGNRPIGEILNINIDNNSNTGSIIFKNPLYWDDRYCTGVLKRNIGHNIVYASELYLRREDMPTYVCSKKSYDGSNTTECNKLEMVDIIYK